MMIDIIAVLRDFLTSWLQPVEVLVKKYQCINKIPFKTRVIRPALNIHIPGHNIAVTDQTSKVATQSIVILLATSCSIQG